MTEAAGTMGPASASIDGVMRLYRRSLTQSWLPALLLSLLWTGLLARLLLALDAQDDVLQLAAQLQELVFAPSFGYALLAATAVSVLPYCAIVACVLAGETGRKAAGAGLPIALRLFPGALVATTLFLVLTSIGTMALLVPGVYLWGMWQLWIVVMVAERSGPLAALARSWQLTRGSWWPAVTLVTLITILSMVPLVLLDFILPSILLVLGISATQALMANLLCLGLASILVLPLVPAALVALYRSLSSRQPVSAGEKR
ncbi:MAG TPA: hypothetical protein VK130_10360 [Steroidobacteraceae bacterium]|nr:hypothetical protein [Steroidobacteraceae bacterium]